MKELGVNYDIGFRNTVEAQILGPIIAFSDVNEIKETIIKHNLLPYDFRNETFRQVFSAILECYEKGINPDLVNLEHLRPSEYRKNNMDFWHITIIDLMKRSITWAEIETHIMILKQFVLMDFWNMRSNKILYGNWNDKDVINVGEEIVGSYKNLFERLTKNLKKDNQVMDYDDEIKMKVERYNAGKPVAISTSVPEIDEFTTGWSLGELYIIAARPGMGKTTFALICAWNAALAGIKVVFFSLEMPRNQLISKLASLITQIDYKRIKAGALTSEELKQVLAARKIIENSNLIIDDKVKTIEDISEKSAEYASIHGVRLFFMDYIQRCVTKIKQDIRLMIIDITRELKSIAKSHYVAFVALSQLNRSVDNRPNKRPVLTDLKESSSIEEDADLVAFLFCQAYYDKQTGQEPGYAELFHTEFIIGKGRDVGTTIIHLFIDPIKMFIKGYNYTGNYDN